ncbi:amidase [Paraburkholderia sp. BCC1884]|uniref:amidase n=1 Tax=Paraburkholderia sp. BCC1884 TaxID=2562668 RepID=UPI001182AFA4|nr:amidase [Paraburkholderia sp. BCC1884]
MSAKRGLDCSMTDLTDAIRGRATSGEQVVDQCLDAIATREHSGFVRLREGVRGNAAQAKAGPLHGIPFARKDMYFRAGELCECGSRILAGHRPEQTATVVTRLEAAGGVDLGALHMAEFAMSPTGLNEHLGPGRNPWSAQHVSGGSSSGSGMAVGGRLVSAALGSDTGGSIRLPAAICGVTGIKPTQNLVSVHGVMPLSPSLDCVGFLAQTARDCARLLSAVVGPDPLDPSCIATETQDYEAGIECRPGADVKIAVPIFGDDALLTTEVRTLLDAAIATLSATGATIVPVTLPDLGEIGDLANVVSASEAAATHRAWLAQRGDEYGAQVRRRIERGLLYPAVRYIEALRMRPILLQRFLQQCLPGTDALILPTLPFAVPTIAETLAGTLAENERAFGQLSFWTRAINYLGLPGLAVPIGFTQNGLPNGMQIIGRPLGEKMVFRIGHHYQQLTDWHARIPPL